MSFNRFIKKHILIFIMCFICKTNKVLIFLSIKSIEVNLFVFVNPFHQTWQNKNEFFHLFVVCCEETNQIKIKQFELIKRWSILLLQYLFWTNQSKSIQSHLSEREGWDCSKILIGRKSSKKIDRISYSWLRLRFKKFSH